MNRVEVWYCGARMGRDGMGWDEVKRGEKSTELELNAKLLVDLSILFGLE